MMYCDWKSLLELLEVKQLIPSRSRRSPEELQALLQPTSHYFAQATALPPDRKRVDSRFRFLATLLKGWRRKFLPSAYGFWIEFESGARIQGFFLQIRGAALEAYYRPNVPRGKSSSEVLRWLTEKHGVPVQSIQISKSDWNECMKQARPWRAIARALRAERARWNQPIGIFRLFLSFPF